MSTRRSARILNRMSVTMLYIISTRMSANISARMSAECVLAKYVRYDVSKDII